MSDYSSLEKICAKQIFVWERRLTFHNGSWHLTIPKPLIKANSIKKNQRIAVVFGQVIDERSGRCLITFELMPIVETELKK